MVIKKNLRTMLVVASFLLLITTAANAKTIYVDADANGSDTGTNWANAYPYLQDALADANSSAKPVEIRVAQGTYKPDEGAGVEDANRTETFQLINGVTLKGGYAGDGETDPNARDVSLYETILSGDLDGNDVNVSNPADLLDEPTRAENSYHVLTASGTDANAVLDGFTITAGNANETVSPNGSGAGMYGPDSRPTVLNCKFTENSAYGGGGGIFLWDEISSGLLITNCTFTNNSAGTGGGVFASPATLNNCMFSSNYVIGSGGGVYSATYGLKATNCIFTNNLAESSGGGLGQYFGSPILTDCIFIGNSATKGWGGGMFFSGSSSDDPELSNCVFINNSTTDKGGGLYLYGGNEPKLTNCMFTGNSAGNYGGGMFNIEFVVSNGKLINCTFSGNTAGNDGGGFSSSHCNTTFTNSTFSGNSTAGGDGGGFCVFGNGGTPDFNNCIFWGNTAFGEGPQIAIKGIFLTTVVTVNYSDVQGGDVDIYDPYNRLVWDDVNNINVDPCFVDADGADDTVGTEDDNLRLLAGSPCIDAGDNNSVPVDIKDIDNDGNTVEPFPWDLDGRPRIIDGDCNDTDIVDMGAYEFGWLYLGDFAGGCDVDFVDFAVLGLTWLKEDGQAGYDPNCDISLPADSLIDEKDLKIFTDNWLSKQ